LPPEEQFPTVRKRNTVPWFAHLPLLWPEQAQRAHPDTTL